MIDHLGVAAQVEDRWRELSRVLSAAEDAMAVGEVGRALELLAGLSEATLRAGDRRLTDTFLTLATSIGLRARNPSDERLARLLATAEAVCGRREGGWGRRGIAGGHSPTA